MSNYFNNHQVPDGSQFGTYQLVSELSIPWSCGPRQGAPPEPPLDPLPREVSSSGLSSRWGSPEDRRSATKEERMRTFEGTFLRLNTMLDQIKERTSLIEEWLGIGGGGEAQSLPMALFPPPQPSTPPMVAPPPSPALDLYGYGATPQQQYETPPSFPQPPQPHYRSLQQPEETEPKVFDEMPVRKLGSMSWCRRCKIQCVTMEGLVLHSLTSEHQNRTMTSVQSIKQNIQSILLLKGSSQFSSWEDRGVRVSSTSSDINIDGDDVSQPDVDECKELTAELPSEIHTPKEVFRAPSSTTDHLILEVVEPRDVSDNVPVAPLYVGEKENDSQYSEDVSPDRASSEVTEYEAEKNAQGSLWIPSGGSTLVNLSDVFGTNVLSVGIGVFLDAATGNFTKYNAGLSITNTNLIALVVLNNMGDLNHLISATTWDPGGISLLADPSVQSSEHGSGQYQFNYFDMNQVQFSFMSIRLIPSIQQVQVHSSHSTIQTSISVAHCHVSEVHVKIICHSRLHNNRTSTYECMEDMVEAAAELLLEFPEGTFLEHKRSKQMLGLLVSAWARKNIRPLTRARCIQIAFQSTIHHMEVDSSISVVYHPSKDSGAGRGMVWDPGISIPWVHTFASIILPKQIISDAGHFANENGITVELVVANKNLKNLALMVWDPGIKLQFQTQCQG